MKRLLWLLVLAAALACSAGNSALAQTFEQLNIAGYQAAQIPCASGVFIPVVPAGSSFTSQYISCSTFATATGQQTLTNKTLVNPVIVAPSGVVKSFLGLDALSNLVSTGTSPGNVSSTGAITVGSLPLWASNQFLTGTLAPTVNGDVVVVSNGQWIQGLLQFSNLGGSPSAAQLATNLDAALDSIFATTGTIVNCFGQDINGNNILSTCGSGGGGGGTVQSGTGPAIAQYPSGTGSTVGPVTVSGDATIAQGGAVTVSSFGGVPFGTLAGASSIALTGVVTGSGSTSIATVFESLSNSQFFGYGGGSGSGAGQPVTIAAGTGISFPCSAQTCTITNTGVTGPGSSTSLFVPQWNGTTGTLLGLGLPVSTTGAASSIVVANSSSHIPASLLSGVPNSALLNSTIALAVPSWLTVSGSPAALGGTLTVSGSSQPANQFVATPNGSTGAVALRAIASADLPLGSASQFGALECGSGTTCAAGVISVAPSGGLPTVNNAQFLGYGAGSGSGTAQAVTIAAGTGITFVCSSQSCTIAASGSGGVSGPGASTNNDLVAWNGTGGNALIDTGVLYTNLATLSGNNVLTGTNTLSSSNLLILGSSTGSTAIASANTSATNYTITLPAATDTVDLISQSQALTNKTYNGLSITANGTNTLNIAAGKTLTDTSAQAATLLLGASGGGFAGYSGTTCTNQFVSVLSSAGAATCNSVGTAYISAAAVTYAKIQNEGPNTFLGNSGGTAATPGELALPVAVTLGGTGLATLTSGAIYKGNGTSSPIASAVSDNGTIVSSTESIDVKANSVIAEVPNAASTGTTLNKLAKLTGAPSTAVIATTSDTTGNVLGCVVGGAGTTGSAQIAIDGQANCAFDGATTAGDYVQVSTTVGGDVHDAGATYPTSGGEIKGIVLSTNASAGTYAMKVFSQGIVPGGAGTGNITGSGATTAGDLISSNNTGTPLNSAVDSGIKSIAVKAVGAMVMEVAAGGL